MEYILKFNCFVSSQISVTTIDVPEKTDNKKFNFNDNHHKVIENNAGGSPLSVSTTGSNRNERRGHHSPNKNSKDLGSGRFITRLDKSHLQKELVSVEPEQILQMFRNIRRNVHEAPKQSKSNWRIKSMLEKRKREGVLQDGSVLNYFDLRTYQRRPAESNDHQFDDDNDYITSFNNSKERVTSASHPSSATTVTTDTDDKTTTSTKNNRDTTSQSSSVSISKSSEHNNTIVSAHEIRQLQELLQDLDFNNSSLSSFKQ